MEINAIQNSTTANHMKSETVNRELNSKAIENQIEGAGDMQKNISSDLKAVYRAINKDGDTLEISSDASVNYQKGMKTKIIEENTTNNLTKMTDAALAKCSKNKLKLLLTNGQISKQQYDKAMKRAR